MLKSSNITQQNITMTSLTYTANNRDGQTWLVADNPYPQWIAANIYESTINPDWKKFQADHPPILLTEHLPDGTKVRGDEIEDWWQYYNTDGIWCNEDNTGHAESIKLGCNTRQVATLKKMRFEAIGIDDEIQSICDWLSEKYNHDFTAEDGRFYKVSRLSIAELIIEYYKSRVKSREK